VLDVPQLVKLVPPLVVVTSVQLLLSHWVLLEKAVTLFAG
jgi:hypothetical protein